jgi:SAM-dependent methyltransferase
MSQSVPNRAGLRQELRKWWKENCKSQAFIGTSRTFLEAMWTFLCESTPERRRQRYGDVEYDWENRLDTTSATVGWRDRLLGALHSPYQPTEPALFHEMLSSLKINFPEFTFIDLGSGKGRALLMAAEYEFSRILGVELLPDLNRIAEQNLRQFKSEKQKCFNLRTACGDAREFVFPAEPTVLYLFNSFLEPGLERVVDNLERSLRADPRIVYVLYHNPLLEHILARSSLLQPVGGTHQYRLYASEQRGQ